MLKNSNVFKQKIDWYQAFLNSAIYIFMFLILATIVIMDTNFLSLGNLSIILSQASTRVIFALGVGGIIVLAGTDLAVGSQVGIAAVIASTMLQAVDHGRRVFPDLPVLPLIVPIAIVMVICATFSIIQATIVTKFKVAPFIASLSMSLVIFGINSLYFANIAGSAPIGGFDPRYTAFAQQAVMLGEFRLNALVVHAVLVSVIIWFIWNKTVLGRNMYAIGDNREAARVSGVNIVRNTMLIYIIAGLAYAYGGVLEGARTGSATNTLGSSYELDAIAACVVGGASLRGGVGKVSGIVVGVLLLQIINFGLVFVGVSPNLQYIVRGAIIIFAVAIDMQKHA